MNKGGDLQYKCRRCGRIIMNTHVPDLHLALMSAMMEFGVPMNNNMKISKYDYHSDCTTLTDVSPAMGICDLIGGVYDKD